MKLVVLGGASQIVTEFGKACNNAIEHVFMSKLIKINISINMYTEVIFKHPYLCNRKEHGFGLSINGFYGASPFIRYQKLKILIFSVNVGFPKSGHNFQGVVGTYWSETAPARA